jgi:ribonuclease HII
MYQIGIDEVGRGPLAGPVVVCAVALKKGSNLLHIFPKGVLRDSKKLSSLQRKKIINEIKQYEIAEEIVVGIGESSASYVDEFGIVPAITKAMNEAFQKILEQGATEIAKVYLDGGLRLPYDCPQETVIRGDEKIIEISLASIIAKEYRDELMKLYDVTCNGYGFINNSGYGTKAHIEAIKSKGVSMFHRRSFLKKYI